MDEKGTSRVINGIIGSILALVAVFIIGGYVVGLAQDITTNISGGTVKEEVVSKKVYDDRVLTHESRW